jgi:plastocyanin
MRVHLLIAAAVLASACGGSDSTTTPNGNQTRTVDVYTIGDAFVESYISIKPGDAVRWNFAGGSDGQGHNVRFAPRLSGSPSDINVLKTGTATRVFNAPGTYSYVCDVHPGMNAQVVVE